MTLRKSFVAAATALTVSIAGVSVATAQDAPVDDQSTITQDDANTTETGEGTQDGADTENTDGADTTDEELTAPEGDFSSELSSGESESGELSSSELSSDMEPEEIKDWIGVFTAAVGGLSALFVFLNRYVLN